MLLISVFSICNVFGMQSENEQAKNAENKKSMLSYVQNITSSVKPYVRPALIAGVIVGGVLLTYRSFSKLTNLPPVEFPARALYYLDKATPDSLKYAYFKTSMFMKEMANDEVFMKQMDKFVTDVAPRIAYTGLAIIGASSLYAGINMATSETQNNKKQ